MANLITYIYERTKRYHYIFLAICIFALFAAASYYAYKKIYIPKQKEQKFEDVANTNDSKLIAEIYFFHAEWCPHCKKAKPEWEQFKRQFDKMVINDYLIQCYEINCTDDNGDVVLEKDSDGTSTGLKQTKVKVADMIRNFGIDSYPTIKLKKDDYTVDFDAKITQDSLEQCVNTVLV